MFHTYNGIPSPPAPSSLRPVENAVISRKRDYVHWRALHYEASLLASALGRLDEQWDITTDTLFSASWPGLRIFAMHLADEPGVLLDEWERTESIGP